MSQGAASRNFRLGLGVRSFQAGKRIPFNLASVFVQVKLPAGLVGKAYQHQKSHTYDITRQETVTGLSVPITRQETVTGLSVLQRSSQTQVLLCHKGPTPSGLSQLLMLRVAVMSFCQPAKSVWSSVRASCAWLQCLLMSLALQLRSGTKSSKHVQPVQATLLNKTTS